MHPNLSFTEAILQATHQAMEADPTVFVMGLGVSYPNGADGTTKGLKDKFPNRIWDTPVSEAALTGAGVGAALSGMKPIIHHGRVEFALFAIDQIVTQAAKWNYMFGGGNPVPITFRIAVGRQWGNGPQHTQSLYGLFGSVPGLKVVIPSSPARAKALLTSSIEDKNPVVYLEPRWLYGTRENVDPAYSRQPLDRAVILEEGADITLVTYGDGVVEALRAARVLREANIRLEVIDLVSLQPMDHATVLGSVKKTGRLMTFDTANSCFCIGSEVIAKACQAGISHLKAAPVSISCPDVPCPTSTVLSGVFYPTKENIIQQAHALMGSKAPVPEKLSFEYLHLAPKFDFTKNE